MATGEVRDRLQPALLDRLTDDNPGQREESVDRRVMSKSQMRQAVLRDLGWLFNATQPMGSTSDLPQAIAESVLNYGLPALSGQLVSRVDISLLERAIRQAILRFEPRLLPETLKIVALEATHVLDTHNTIEFEIRGHMWAQPVPMEVLLRTKLDLEAGQVEVRDASGVAPSRAF